MQQDSGDPMKLPLYILTIFLGVVLAVHLAMNGKVGSVINNPPCGERGLLVYRRDPALW